MHLASSCKCRSICIFTVFGAHLAYMRNELKPGHNKRNLLGLCPDGGIYLKRAIIAVGLAALLTGCGGSGGSGSGLSGSSFASLFITDSMDGNDHVWVLVKS